LALEPGDDLARQIAGEGIGLDEDQRSLHARRVSFDLIGARRRRAAQVSVGERNADAQVAVEVPASEAEPETGTVPAAGDSVLSRRRRVRRGGGGAPISDSQ